MITQMQMIIVAVSLSVLIGIGLYVKSLNDQVIVCETNTKIQKDRYETSLENYDKNIEDIAKYYNGEITKVDTFKRTSNETDCQASKRFFDRTGY